MADKRGIVERLQQIFDQAPSFMVELRGPEHRMTSCNEAYRALVGYRDLLGLTIREAIPEAAAQGYVDLLDHVYASGEPFVGRGALFEVERPRGSRPEPIYVDFIYQPLRDADGRIDGIFVQGHDVTEQHRAMAALRQSEERLRLAMRAASLGAFEVDASTLRLHWSDSALRMFGYASEEELDLQEPINRIHPEDRARVSAAVVAAMDPMTSGAYHEIYRVLWPDGSLRWIDATGQGQFEERDGERRATHFVGVLSDITDQQQRIASLHEADARKDEFLAMLAHELRNPLAPLTNALKLLERAEPLTDRGRSTVGLAQRQAHQLQRLVDDLLEVSRISQGKIELKPESMTVATAVYQAVDSVAAAFEARSQLLEVAVPVRLVQIVADPMRVAQVLENLLTNAGKYTPEGGRIRIEVEDQAHDVAIRVIDDGIGIEPAKIGRLFELFHQIDATLDRSAGGLGIGLALVKRLVELHGGTVGASSAGLGRGSTFTVRLPYAATGPDTDRDESGSRQPTRVVG